MPQRLVTLLSLVLSFCLWPTISPADEPTVSSEHLRFFESKIRPLLAENCHKCHGAKKQNGELRLDSRSAILAGGESGPAIVPGKPQESLLVEAINYESLEMPPTGRLKDEEIALLTQWVRIGAPWPADDPSVPLLSSREKITDEDRAFWSFQPLRHVVPPDVDDDGWCRNELDRFIFRRLHENDLKPSAEADRVALLRRVYFDLIGLPPTPNEIYEFMSNDFGTALEALVDRLLDDPRYGERWARHWLDLVRYAESDGYKQDAYRPEAWRYRDYVIRSLNEDMPYDRFVMEQLAGDEIAPGDPDAVIATSFLRLWIYEYNQRDVRTQWSNILNDVTDVTGDVFLGMGMGCARCHDHKFDPILQRDYYRLQAFFTPMLPREDIPLSTAEEVAAYNAQLAKWQATTADIRRQIEEIERPIKESAAKPAINKFPPDIRPMMSKPPQERSPLEHQLAEFAYRQAQEEIDKIDMASKLKGEEKSKWESLQKQLAEFDKLKPKAPPMAVTVTDVGPVAPPTIIPGDRKREDIQPGFLSVLDPSDAEIQSPASVSDSTGRRTALARWIASPQNPLSTRVIVNRVWQYHFGRGLASTSSDFGRLGDPPSHPELLDWLTNYFIDNGWSLKKLHRLIMTSATYRQSALREMPDVARLKDPQNRLLWRFDSRRLDAEQIRDAMLAASGELNPAAGGPSVDVSQPRRTIYTKVIRNDRDPLLDVFDAPDNFNSTSERNTTTTPTQSLLMINGPWVLERAAALAGRLSKQAFDHDEELVAYAYRLALGREPDSLELAEAVAFLDEQSRRVSPQKAAPVEPLAGTMPGRENQAAAFDPSSQKQRLAVPDHPSLPAGDFTIEAVIFLRSLYADASVRTIAAQWDSDTGHPGWSLGVTSEKSKFQPRNLILQLVGNPAKGGAGYEVVASNLRPELNKPYYVAASVKIGDKSERGVTFYLKDLSQPNAPLQTASAAHKVSDHYRSKDALTIGGRDRTDRHNWDGLIDDVRLTAAALAPDQLLIGSASAIEHSVGFWRFDGETTFYSDASGKNNNIQATGASAGAPADPRTAALVDFCHVLLNSNEFLYVD